MTSQPPNAFLLPSHESDHMKLAGLAQAPPPVWINLILFDDTNTPADKDKPAVDCASGLLIWTKDTNWPICEPTAHFLRTTLLNDETRYADGMLLVDAIKRVFRESNDRQWIYNMFDTILSRTDDQSWVFDQFNREVRELGERVPKEVKSEYGLDKWFMKYGSL